MNLSVIILVVTTIMATVISHHQDAGMPFTWKMTNVYHVATSVKIVPAPCTAYPVQKYLEINYSTTMVAAIQAVQMEQ